jgi:flagellar biosynthesis GTPase FlhF
MQIKTYRAATMRKALEQVKLELGEDALVIDTRRVTVGSFLGFGGRPVIELRVAADPTSRPASRGSRGERRARRDNGIELSDASPAVLAHSPARPDRATAGEVERLRSELREMKHSLGMLSAQSALLHARRRTPARSWPRIRSFSTRRSTKSSCISRRRGSRRSSPGPPFARSAPCPLGPEEVGLAAHAGLVASLSSSVRFAEDPLASLPSGTPPALALIGPTGVGKTTTVAKLAARVALRERRRVELADYLRTNDAILKCLVLQATTHPTDAWIAARKFSLYGPDRLVLTKLDETARPGAAAGIAADSGLPTVYLCTGQRVPEDIERATPDALASRVVRPQASAAAL